MLFYKSQILVWYSNSLYFFKHLLLLPLSHFHKYKPENNKIKYSDREFLVGDLVFNQWFHRLGLHWICRGMSSQTPDLISREIAGNEVAESRVPFYINNITHDPATTNSFEKLRSIEEGGIRTRITAARRLAITPPRPWAELSLLHSRLCSKATEGRFILLVPRLCVQTKFKNGLEEKPEKITIQVSWMVSGPKQEMHQYKDWALTLPAPN